MAGNYEQCPSDQTQPYKVSQTSCFTPFKLSPPQVQAQAQAFAKKVKVSAPSPSSQRSSNYSPPPVATPAGPKSMLYPRLNSSYNPVANPSAGSSMSDTVASRLSFPMAAPWNKQQADSCRSQYVVKRGCEAHHSEPINGEHPSKRQRVGEDARMVVETCDNYGCNGFHNHEDCPLEKCCWGCRSVNHFWSECPMTCKECGFERHIPKHCDDFEVSSHGMAYPRKPRRREATGMRPHLPTEKVFTCDNYNCRDMHSHWDCPLPVICWGCRAKGHFWSGCKERCRKCALGRHVAEYCEEFEYWRDDISRPKRPLEDVITYAMKRQREQEIDREQGIESSLKSVERLAASPTAIKLGSSSPIPNYLAPSPALEPEVKGNIPPKRPAIDSYRPIDTYRHVNIVAERRKSTTPTPSYGTNRSWVKSRPILDTRFRDKEYCSFWLRTGTCSYEYTPLGCKYKHEIPEQQVLWNMGIPAVPKWLKEKTKLHSASMVWKAPAVLSAKRPAQSSGGSFKREEPPASVTEWKAPAGSVRKETDQSLERPFERAVSSVSTNMSSRAQPLTPQTIGFSPPVLQLQQPSHHRYSTPLGQTPGMEPPTSVIQPPMSAKMQAFEEEEYFKRRRHEAEMKRKADEQKMEYEHGLRMAELRRRWSCGPKPATSDKRLVGEHDKDEA